MKERAGFGIRFVATLIDCLLLLVISVGVGLLAGSATSLLMHKLGLTAAGNDPTGALIASGAMGVIMFLLVTSVVMWLLSLPYNLMEALFGWTPGKLMTGLRVRNQDGSRPSIGQVLARWALKHNAIILSILTVSGIPFTVLSPFGQAIIFLGCFLVLTSSRQALHDMATRTAVYETSVLNEQRPDPGPL